MASWGVLEGDCLHVMKSLADGSVDAIVTDPPYGLGFMGKAWDALPPGRPWAEECLRVLRPGGYLLAFGGTRTYHRLVVALEDGGFTIVDQLAWMHGQGFPKGKSQLKPAQEPIVLSRKPAPRVEPLNIDDCRIEATDSQLAEKYASIKNAGPRDNRIYGADGRERSEGRTEPHAGGRWPANVVLDEEAGALLDEQTGVLHGHGSKRHSGSANGLFDWGTADRAQTGGESGGASRFFYCAKPSKAERHNAGQNPHTTVKPVALMQWLVRLVTPADGLVLDPFVGSGTTGMAALREGRRFLGIEHEPEYVQIARARIAVDFPLANAGSEAA